MLVLARKYRPRRLDEVVGQPVVVKTISNSIQRNTLHHAYVLVGQFGSGKTTVARILAASENCKVSPGLYPCGKCDICVSIFEGKHADVKEIDAASTGKIDEIRELKREVLYNPTDGAVTKYIILDEVQGMSMAANDALLKTLEEPPSRTRFILCTTDISKVRPAIVSRCQRHDFIKIYWMQIAEHLAMVAKQEKLEIDTGAVNICAKLAKGSMRNGLNNLEKLISYADGPITSKFAEQVFYTCDEKEFFDLFDELLKVGDGTTDATNAYGIINKMLRQGVEYSNIANGIIEHLDNVLIGLTCSKAGDFVYLSEDGKNRMREQLKKCKSEDRLKAVMQSIYRMKKSNESVQYGIPAETALRTWFIHSIFDFKE